MRTTLAFIICLVFSGMALGAESTIGNTSDVIIKHRKGDIVSRNNGQDLVTKPQGHKAKAYKNDARPAPSMKSSDTEDHMTTEIEKRYEGERPAEGRSIDSHGYLGIYNAPAISRYEQSGVERAPGEPDISRLFAEQRLDLPSRSNPRIITHKVDSPGDWAFGRYIVFARHQRGWAKGLIKEGAFGCCTDCERIDDSYPSVQMCSKEMLRELGVDSIPTIVNLQ
ncbi:MAG: hypothetical protein M1510_13145 [Nitrospirae bacterium]|nr:hypothetical protein [Nitrospirota bacterium]